jgi:hypothetical protein
MALIGVMLINAMPLSLPARQACLLSIADAGIRCVRASS